MNFSGKLNGNQHTPWSKVRSRHILIPIRDSNLGNLCSGRQLPHNLCHQLFRALTLGTVQMINIPILGVASALVVCAIVARMFAPGNQKAEKSQKADIIKQLLELSERENRLSGAASSARRRAPLSNERTRPGNAPRKATPKISQPVRSTSPSPKSLTRS
jgi:hypothetical protein